MAIRDPLRSDEVRRRLDALDGWDGDVHQISKTFAVSYDSAIQIVTDIGAAAKELEHRPDIDIRWDRLRIAMTTHTAGDVVTELDFLLATRIDRIAEKYGAVTA
ncbi:4a-hydroxytetrahydrobiopterin dehydratase [Streptosporangium album]|uniref:Putative pterin-4-alpha-carbinolamine dehydratase n=1 Tax=Streptosporangium album TaxID=47479 RepID=A0A7W7RXG3_9ACTN|nr:4a-hydroxytetrahydrobiopterin dehydratase [Streptosporangium album]MBB4940068.1 4a-hydroxytetrahydrobiopterin dehydratase [Streptosporangium album]